MDPSLQRAPIADSGPFKHTLSLRDAMLIRKRFVVHGFILDMVTSSRLCVP